MFATLEFSFFYWLVLVDVFTAPRDPSSFDVNCE